MSESDSFGPNGAPDGGAADDEWIEVVIVCPGPPTPEERAAWRRESAREAASRNGTLSESPPPSGI